MMLKAFVNRLQQFLDMDENTTLDFKLDRGIGKERLSLPVYSISLQREKDQRHNEMTINLYERDPK